VDLTAKNITGKDAAIVLDKAGITVNKNLIPYDPKSPFVASGIRIGTPALTTRGMKEAEMKKIARMVDEVISSPSDEKVLQGVRKEVAILAKQFPLYKKLASRLERE
jgi:glycine hydroxymethyltransferase